MQGDKLELHTQLNIVVEEIECLRQMRFAGDVTEEEFYQRLERLSNKKAVLVDLCIGD